MVLVLTARPNGVSLTEYSYGLTEYDDGVINAVKVNGDCAC